MTRKQVLAILSQAGFQDVHVKRDGTFEVRLTYFYRHAMTGEKWGEKVMSRLSEQFELVSTNDKWAVWPKDSYFSAYIRPVVVDSSKKVVQGVDKANNE